MKTNSQRRQNGIQRFLDEEVEVSENGSLSSDETEGSVLDQSLDGFINDATLASQQSPSGKKGSDSLIISILYLTCVYVCLSVCLSLNLLLRKDVLKI